jgi:hypothetical protein
MTGQEEIRSGTMAGKLLRLEKLDSRMKDQKEVYYYYC